MSPAAAQSVDLTQALAAIAAGQSPQVFVLHGDEYLCRSAIDELVGVLMPPNLRTLNLVELDAAAGPGQVADELATLPMLRGPKVVTVQPAEFLAPKRAARGDPFAKPLELWEAGKQKDAARRVLALAGRAGFSLDSLRLQKAADWKAAGFSVTAKELALVAQVADLARAERLAIPESDTRSLEGVLAAGLPVGHVLLVAVEELDAKSPLVRACLTRGVELRRELAGQGAKFGQREARDVRGLAQEILGPLGKALSADAQRLLSRGPEDARTLASELEKLAAFVGERKQIEVADVRELVPAGPSEDLFALSNALEARDPDALLAALDEELERGAAPLQLLAGLATAVRGLLQARARLAALKIERRFGFQEFERKALPAFVEADEAAGRKPGHPFRTFKRAEAAMRYSLAELAATQVQLARADAGIKRGWTAGCGSCELLWRSATPEREGLPKVYMSKKLLVTSALPYANGPIHLGHLVEYLQTDIFVRAMKLDGRDVTYVCADDAHGTPIELNAQKQGIAPEALVARTYQEHVADFSAFGVGFDEYGSTHTEENRHFAELVYARLKAGGHIEKRALELSYCETDKRFLPDRFVRGICPRCSAPDQYGDVCEVCKSTYSPTDLKDPRCAICGTPPVRKQSENYFFALDHFGELLADIAYGRHAPVLDPQIQRFLQGWITQGLQDWCISRDGPYFGFPIPDAPGKFFYVWLDAPIGYLSNTERLMKRLGGSAQSFWAPDADAEIWHFIGKDIIYFHALFWPAMLAGAQFKLPARIVVHGMLNVKGEKMSKSRGRPLTARGYLDLGLHPEQLRYYYAANLTPQPNDIDLNVEDFRHRVNAELVNNLANFCHRTLSLLRSRFEGALAPASTDALAAAAWQGMVERFPKVIAGYRALEFREAVAQLVEIGNVGNLFLQQRKPWELGEHAHGDLSLCANGALAIATLLQPIAPTMAAAILAQLTKPEMRFADLTQPDLRQSPWLWSGTLAAGPASLMARIEATQASALLPEVAAEVAPAAAKVAAKVVAPAKPAGETPPVAAGLISYDQFAALELRCGLIRTAEAVAGASKLLRLTVDLGEGEPRVIASGIAESFAPEALVGLRVVVVANLAPRKIRGIESRGMLLASGEGAAIRLVSLPEDVSPGAEVR